MATGHYALVLRSPQGVISLPAVAESTSPFDVELGPSGGSGIAAVYSRCANNAARKGCQLAELRLGVAEATEQTLAPPGGGSDHEPAIWKGGLVFLRRNPVGRQAPPRQSPRLADRQPQAAGAGTADLPRSEEQREEDGRRD